MTRYIWRSYHFIKMKKPFLRYFYFIYLCFTLRTEIFWQRYCCYPLDKNIVRALSAQEAVQYLLAHNFCNPHQLVKDKRKIELRTNFFRRLFEQTDVYLVNTTATPQETQNEIRKVLSLKK